MNYYVDEDELSYFLIENVSSREFKFVISEIKGLFDLPNKDVQVESVQGRNGDLIIDYGSYENKEIKVSGYINSETQTELANLARLFKVFVQGNKGYQKIMFSDYEGVYFEGMCINKMSVDEVLEAFGEIELTFTCKPYAKDMINSEIDILEKGTLVNNEGCESEPIISFAGQGDCSISINNQVVNFKGLEGQIVVNSEIMDCYRDTVDSGIVALNNKMVGDFPILEKGGNIISWEGNVTELKIIPNFNYL